jgi:hypothetical protein
VGLKQAAPVQPRLWWTPIERGINAPSFETIEQMGETAARADQGVV